MVLNQDARREVLPGAFLALARGLFKQPLEGGSLDVDVERRPLDLVDQPEELLQIDRVVEPRLSAREDVAEQAALLAEFAQEIDVVILQSSAGLAGEARPVAALRQFDVALIRHLEEQQIGELLDVIAVVDAVVAKRVAEAPEFLDYIGHTATASLNWLISCGSCPAKTLLARPQPPTRLKTGKASKSLGVDGQVFGQVPLDALKPLHLLGREVLA